MHLLYENFLLLLERKNTNIGLHWRGDAEIQIPQKMQNCPYPLAKLFKNVHNQLLQWNWTKKSNSDMIFGVMHFPDVNIFETPLYHVILDILGEKRTGNLYEWVEDLLYDGYDFPAVGTYIFVDDLDKNFCHLVVKSNSEFVPTVFGIDDFLLLYAHTRGVDGLYYMLANGCSVDFLCDKLFNLPLIFDNVDLDFCIEKFYEQHIYRNRTKKEVFEIYNNVKIEVKDQNFLIYIDGILQNFPFTDSVGLILVQDIMQSLKYAEEKDENYNDWHTYASTTDDENNVLSVSHWEKNMIEIESILYNEIQERKSGICDAISFYTEFLRAIKEFIDNEANLKIKNNWLFEYKKLKTMLRFLYLGYFEE